MAKPNPLPAVSNPVEHEWKQKQTIKEKHKRTRRGYGKKKNNENNFKEFCLLGSNANGIQFKKESLQQNINQFKPTVITLQETKLRSMGKFKPPGYQV